MREHHGVAPQSHPVYTMTATTGVLSTGTTRVSSLSYGDFLESPSDRPSGAPPGYVRQGNYYAPSPPPELPREPRYPLDVQHDLRHSRSSLDPRDSIYARDYLQDPRDAYLMPATNTPSLPYNERSVVVSAPPGYVRQGNYFVPVPASAPQPSPSNIQVTVSGENVAGTINEGIEAGRNAHVRL